jgi:hypothetical protein
MTQEQVTGTNFLKTTIEVSDLLENNEVTIITTPADIEYIDIVVKVNTLHNATSDLVETLNVGNTLVDVTSVEEGQLFSYRVGTDKDIKLQVSDTVTEGEFIILTECR